MPYHTIDWKMFTMLKFLGRNARWRTYRGGSYDTAIERSGYRIEIEEEGRYTRVLLWSPTHPCFVADLDMSDKVAILLRLEYSSSCSVDGKMTRGDGTKKMMEFMFSLLKELGATKVQLQDESTITCKGKAVSLMWFSFMKYGQTWYERNFKFHPIDRHARKYEQAKDNWSRSKYDPIPCDAFTEDFIDKLAKELDFTFYRNIVWEKEL